MNGPAALPTQYADSMMAFVVTLFVCPDVVCDTQVRAKTKPVVPTTDHEGQMNLRVRETSNVPVNQRANSNPTLSCQGRKLTRNTPRRLGTRNNIPTHAMLPGMCDAIVTPVKIVTISITPLTELSNVVCSGLKPKDTIII